MNEQDQDDAHMQEARNSVVYVEDKSDLKIKVDQDQSHNVFE